MPPKSGLLGTLSSIALAASVAAGSTAAVAQDEQRFAELCNWIDQLQATPADIGRLNEIIGRLNANDQECYFDPVTGQNYCRACLTLAANKLVELVQTGETPAEASH